MVQSWNDGSYAPAEAKQAQLGAGWQEVGAGSQL
jgi:hypothetical protein